MTKDSNALDEYTARMGVTLGELFYALHVDFYWMRMRWDQHGVLYRSAESRIDVLNEAAPGFFRIVQDALLDDTILAIARLTGPPRSMGKDNLAIARVAPLLTDPTLRLRIEDLVAAAQQSATFAKDWRNRRLAHRDLDLALDKAATALEIATYERVDVALRAIEAVLTETQVRLCESSFCYDLAAPIGDAQELLTVLVDGLERGRDRHAAWSRGEDFPDAPDV